MAVLISMFSLRRQNGGGVTVLAVFFAMIGLGAWLGGKPLADRFMNADLSDMSGRKLIYEDATRMARDFSVFGSGAETFAPLYFFYRTKDPFWNAYVHNDYLEALITFGWVGLTIVFLVFICVLLVPFVGNGIPAPPEFILSIGLAIAGILIHARFDLPFQTYSLHFEFTMVCALLTTLKWERR